MFMTFSQVDAFTDSDEEKLKASEYVDAVARAKVVMSKPMAERIARAILKHVERMESSSD